MKIAYFDCIAGASGDMILGALVDAGLPLADLREQLSVLHLPGFDLTARRVAKNAFAATKVDVVVADSVPERHLQDIIAIVAESDLPDAIKERAIAIFRKIGTAEAAIHGTSLDEVHLHELGGVDTIVDVVGTLVGLAALDVGRVVVSPIPLGRGFIRGAHGRIPLPAPATIALLKGAPIVGSPLQAETVTPTGAALLASLADEFGAIPAMMLESIGYGAGSRDLAVPNVLRILIGTPVETMMPHTGPPHVHHHGLPYGSHSHGAGEHHEHTHSHEHVHGEAGDEGTSHAHFHRHMHPDADEESLGHTHPHDHEHDHTHTHGGVADVDETGEGHHDHAHTHDTLESAPPLHAPIERGANEATDHTHAHSHPHSHSCLDTTTLRVLETNIDDMNPETYEFVMDALFAAGALDVFLAPIQMKKNRPATLLRVLSKPDDVATLTAILFTETTTLGVREQTVDRHALSRIIDHVDTPYGPVHVKIAELGDGRVKSAPEYQDCRQLATAHGVPLREVYQAAQEAARARFGG